MISCLSLYSSETIKKEQDDSQDTNEKGPDIIPFTIESGGKGINKCII